MSNEKNIFSNILKKTREMIGEENFAFAYSSVELISLKNDKLIFGVPAEFIKDFIEKNRKELHAAAKEVGGIDEVEVIISDQENAADFYPEQIKEKEKYVPIKETKRVEKNNVKHSKMSRTFTFENFVVGEGNQFAHSIASVIAKNPGSAHNPCLFYGDVGLGKTHILQAIGNEIEIQYPDYKIAFYSSEEFLNDFVDSIKDNKMKEFKMKTRKVDVLILDDIQFFSGKERLQEEFFHIFNFLQSQDKQMIFASDRPIHKIRELEERLQSRFRSKMVADLQAPSKETALGIIRNALSKNVELHNSPEKSFDISPRVIEFIVDRMRYNIRDMLGMLNRVVGYQNITQKKVEVDLVIQWAAEYQPRRNQQRKNTIDNIVTTTANFFEIPSKDITGKRRSRDITRIRHITMYLLKTMTKNSMTEIGKVFNVSHVAVSAAVTSIRNELEVEPETKNLIDDIKEKIHQKEG